MRAFNERIAGNTFIDQVRAPFPEMDGAGMERLMRELPESIIAGEVLCTFAGLSLPGGFPRDNAGERRDVRDCSRRGTITEREDHAGND